MLALAASEGLLDFYLARFLQGIGASLMWVSVRTIVADINQPLDRGSAMGQLMAVSVRGSMLGAVDGFTLLGFMPLQKVLVIVFLTGFASALIEPIFLLYLKKQI